MIRALTWKGWLLAALIAVAAVGAAIYFIRSDAAKGEEIAQLQADLAEREATIDALRRSWAASTAREGVTAAEAARICAAEGSSAFDRGVAFGRASCGL